MDHKRLHAVVEGLVQGVGFRNFVEEKALRLDVTGWVRNTQAGDVEVLAEGPEPALLALLQELQRGPRIARVTRVTTDWLEPTGEYTLFSIESRYR